MAEILSIVNEIPLGIYKTEVALRLREAMLVNGILYNSEAWHGVTSAQIATLESINEALLRGILKAHAKTPKEFLYLETGATPLKWIMAQKRINYAKHIMNRSDDELVKRVLLAQINTPTQGDFIKLLEKDLQELGISFEEAVTSKITKEKIKVLAKSACFKSLLETQKTHNKYKKWEMQPYLRSPLFKDKEMNILTALRSQCVRGIKSNFKKMFKWDKCPLKCDPGNTLKDTPQHILSCKVLGNTSNGTLDHIHGIIEEQQDLAKVYLKLMTKRN